jgi:hypothetical protein
MRFFAIWRRPIHAEAADDHYRQENLAVFRRRHSLVNRTGFGQRLWRFNSVANNKPLNRRKVAVPLLSTF